MDRKWKQLIFVVNFWFGLRVNQIPNKIFILHSHWPLIFSALMKTCMYCIGTWRLGEDNQGFYEQMDWTRHATSGLPRLEWILKYPRGDFNQKTTLSLSLHVCYCSFLFFAYFSSGKKSPLLHSASVYTICNIPVIFVGWLHKNLKNAHPNPFICYFWVYGMFSQVLRSKGGRSSDCPILRYWRRSSDCIGRSFSRILEATQSLHRIKSGFESDKIASSIEIYCKLGNCVAWSL